MRLPCRIRHPLSFFFALSAVENKVRLGQHHRRARLIRCFIVDVSAPAHTEPDHHAVLPLLQIGSDVIGLVKSSLAQIRNARAQHFIAHPDPVDIKLMVSAGGHIHQGACRNLLQLISLTNPRIRHTGLWFGHILARHKHLIGPHPFCIPVFFAHRPHGPESRLAPVAPIARLIRYPDPPPAIHRITKRLALILDLRGVRTPYDPRIPEVRLTQLQKPLRARHLNPVCPLRKPSGALVFGFELPE